VAWNPRYVAFCYPMAPADRLRMDTEAGPCMLPFVLWNGERWREFRTLRGVRRDDPINATPEFHLAYNDWLWKQVGVADPDRLMRFVNETDGTRPATMMPFPAEHPTLERPTEIMGGPTALPMAPPGWRA